VAAWIGFLEGTDVKFRSFEDSPEFLSYAAFPALTWFRIRAGHNKSGKRKRQLCLDSKRKPLKRLESLARAPHTQLKLGVNEKGVEMPMRAHPCSAENSEEPTEFSGGYCRRRRKERRAAKACGWSRQER
jgi:hypothetical protein